MAHMKKIIAARSVHLGWDTPESSRFQVRLRIHKSVPGSFFMAVGWSQGYFGIQELTPGKFGLICSVWDSNTVDPDPVQQAKALYAIPGATVRRFGGEGAGLQCVSETDLGLEDPMIFSVDATVITNEWTKFSARVNGVRFVDYLSRMEGRRLRGFYSFIEDFRRDGKSA